MNAYIIPGIDRDPSSSIFKQVCRVYYKTPQEVMKNRKTRKQPFVTIRQLTMAVMRRETPKSFAEIGEFFGLNHATAIHAVKTISNLRETDKRFRKLTEPLFDETIRI